MSLWRQKKPDPGIPVLKRSTKAGVTTLATRWAVRFPVRLPLRRLSLIAIRGLPRWAEGYRCPILACMVMCRTGFQEEGTIRLPRTLSRTKGSQNPLKVRRGSMDSSSDS